jgi:protein phosphatase
MDLLIAHVSDIGRVRSENEDAVLWFPVSMGDRGQLLAVCDGMGGIEAGEVASRLAVDTIGEVYLAAIGTPEEALRRAVVEANRRIQQAAAEQLGGRAMGTTCTAVAVVGDRAYVAHVGDSRAYRVRNRTLRRLTRDHSVWAERVRAGQQGITPAVTSGRNQLTRALGVEPSVEVDCSSVDLQPGDRLVVCSDGLWGLVTDHEILTVVRTQEPAEACARLAALANRRGGPDNISVIVAEVRDSGAAMAANAGASPAP